MQLRGNSYVYLLSFVSAASLCVSANVRAQEGPDAEVEVNELQTDSEFAAVAELADVGTKAISMKLCSGKTPEGATNWVEYGTNGIYVDVSTSTCGFDSTPIYLVNMHGNSQNWATTGGSSAYSRTATGFRIYVRFYDSRAVDPYLANSRGWHIQWLAVGY